MSQHYVALEMEARAAEKAAAEAVSAAREKRAKVNKARKLLSDLDFPLPNLPEEKRIAPTARKAHVYNTRASWVKEIERAVTAEGEISYADLKDHLSTGPLAHKMTGSLKGFYSALNKLAAKNVIVRHNDHAFTPEAFEAYQDDVINKIRDEVRSPSDSGHGKVGAAILKYLEVNTGGVSAPDMFRDLKLANTNSGYNALRRLQDEGLVDKDDAKREYHLLVKGTKTGAVVTLPSREGADASSQKPTLPTSGYKAEGG